MTTNKRCSECGQAMRIAEDEFCAYCDVCMIVAFMPRMAFNSLKAETLKFTGTEDEFAVEYDVMPNMARRAYRSAKRRLVVEEAMEPRE